MTNLGQEDQFVPPKLSARSVIRKQTVAATRGDGRDAPKAAIGNRSILTSRPLVMSSISSISCIPVI
jgi:hypothetical protein